MIVIWEVMQRSAGNEKTKRKRNTTQAAAAKHSLHQLRKRRHIVPKCRESQSPKRAMSLCASMSIGGSFPRVAFWEAVKCSAGTFLRYVRDF